MWRYLLIWPLSNIRHRPGLSALGVASVAAVVMLVAGLQGFVRGHEAAVQRDVDRVGFDLLVTARGCPYEAATLMLRGGVGLRYMPAGSVGQIEASVGVRAVHPMLLHPVRDPGTDGGMRILKGVRPDFLERQGLVLREGAGLGPAGGVVLGHEAAELEQRHAGDAYWVPDLGELTVLGVLARSGSQTDGMVLMELSDLQARTGLADRLTGLGLELEQGADRAALQAGFDELPGLQAIGMDTVRAALDASMRRLVEVVSWLTGILALLGASLVANTALLAALASQRGRYVLHALGKGGGFIGGAMVVESALLVGAGALLGLALAPVAGASLAGLLGGQLSYAPAQVEVALGVAGSARILAFSLLLGGLSTLPALLWVVRASHPAWVRGRP